MPTPCGEMANVCPMWMRSSTGHPIAARTAPAPMRRTSLPVDRRSPGPSQTDGAPQKESAGDVRGEVHPEVGAGDPDHAPEAEAAGPGRGAQPELALQAGQERQQDHGVAARPR